MTTNTDDTTVRLPHTGLWVPNRSLSVTALRQMQTHDGVAYTANLRMDNRIIGTIENEGCGGMTRFFPRDYRAYGEKQLDAYAERCRSEEGGPVTAENLLDELIDEYDWTRKTAAAQRKGQMLLRLMDHILRDGVERVGDPYPRGEASSAIPRNDRHWQELATQVLDRMDPGPHGWWQAWTGTAWRDVTPRPDGVSPELYG